MIISVGMADINLASFPGRFEGEEKNGLVYTVDACALFPQTQGNSCKFINPPLNSNVILRYMFTYISSFSLARNTAVLATTRLHAVLVLYYTIVRRFSMEWSGEYLLLQTGFDISYKLLTL